MSSLQVIAFVVFNKHWGVIITLESEDLSRLESRVDYVNLMWVRGSKKRIILNKETIPALDGTE